MLGVHPTYEIKITGIVQGVGFRPMVFRCAQIHNIKGKIINNTEGVIIHAQASPNNLEAFICSIKNQAPNLSRIDTININEINWNDQYTSFQIDKSENTATKSLVTPPDSYVCKECLDELFNPHDRRYYYPFINCIQCGPRYSIITDIPYDRPNTTMQHFHMCEACKLEYENPLNRRFHAQPIACPQCGPILKLYNNENQIVSSQNPIKDIVDLLKQGKVLAVKGLGGYHLMVDPFNSKALALLRERKKREEKPFGLVFSSVEDCRSFCDLTLHEEQLLLSTERPIVLAKKSKNQGLSDLVAPRNLYFGIMLAYTPLQHLILRNNFTCLVCTSANISDEPIIHEDNITQLTTVADFVVSHDRGIHAFVDDSVIRSVKGHINDEVQIIRRARGYVPKTLPCSSDHHRKILALGSELKNTICIVKNGMFLQSQHIGDLKNQSTYKSFQKVIEHYKKIFDFEPEIAACDLHPNFLNTSYANKLKIPLIRVQHHYAHLCACMAENHFNQDAIGVIFDGMGYGIDGNIWGGEFLVGNYREFQRVAHFEYFQLPGGDICRKKIIIPAFSYLLKALHTQEEILKHWAPPLSEAEMELYQKMIKANINSPLTSSVGRIFDIAAALTGLCNYSAYEGQAAIILEQSITTNNYDLAESYPYYFYLKDNNYLISLNETFLSILRDRNTGVPIGSISFRFHNTIVKIIYEMCLQIRKERQIQTVALSGGCFQNKFLLECTIQVLSNNGFKVIYHRDFPTNDGGISLGQAAHVIYGDL